MITIKCWTISGIPFFETPNGGIPKDEMPLFGSKDKALTPSSTTSTATTPAKLDQPMPTSIKGQAWLQGLSNRWKGKPQAETAETEETMFLRHREVSWRISQQFLLCNKKQKKTRQELNQIWGFTNKHLRSDPIDLT